jgi:putative protease
MALLKKKKKKLPKKVKKVKKAKIIKKKPVQRKPVKKTPKKKPASKPVAAAKKLKKPKEAVLGKVTHYFPHVRAAVVKVSAPFAVGDTVKIKGHTTEFKQVITSMQIDRSPIQKTKKGDEIGLLVQSRVRRKDTVYKA